MKIQNKFTKHLVYTMPWEEINVIKHTVYSQEVYKLLRKTNMRKTHYKPHYKA